MLKAIDWRLRPPFGSFQDSYLYKEDMEGKTNIPKAAKDFDMAQMIAEMDGAGIALGVVPMRKGNDNGDIEALKKAYPGRFAGLAHIDPFDGEEALKAIDRYVGPGKADGIIMEPGQFFLKESMPADDRRLWPIYEKCQAEHILVSLTFGGLFCDKLENYNPIYIDRVAKMFPDLTLVLSHGGWPYVTEICHVAYQRANVYLDIDYYGFTTNPGYQDYVTAANNVLQDKILFGSCYPGFALDEAIRQYLSNGLKEDILPKVLYDNAARLLKLSK